MKQAYSIEEFAKDHSISRSQVYAEIKAGRLVPMKVGRRKLISREAAEKWRRAMEGWTGDLQPVPVVFDLIPTLLDVPITDTQPTKDIEQIANNILNAVDTIGLSGDN